MQQTFESEQKMQDSYNKTENSQLGGPYRWFYVITVGAVRPVNFWRSEISKAMLINGLSISLAFPRTLSFSYESMYILAKENINARRM